jgi:hypothetical protein
MHTRTLSSFSSSWFKLHPTHFFVERLTDRLSEPIYLSLVLPFLRIPEHSLGTIASFQRVYLFIEYDAIWHFATPNEQGPSVIAESIEHNARLHN